MTARDPPLSTKSSSASTFGPIEPEANVPVARRALSSSTVTAPTSRASGGTEVGYRAGHIGGDDEQVRSYRGRELRCAEVLVDDCGDPNTTPIRWYHRNSAPRRRRRQSSRSRRGRRPSRFLGSRRDMEMPQRAATPCRRNLSKSGRGRSFPQRSPHPDRNRSA
jgi:hypothetical protein